MIKLKSLDTFLYFAKAYPVRGALMVLALGFSGLLEGVGVMALLPLVSILTEQTGEDNGLVFQTTQNIFEFFAIDISVGPILFFIVVVMFLKALMTMFAMAQVVYASSHVCADLRLSYLRNLLQSNWLHFTDLQSGASANAIGMEATRSANCFTQACNVLSWTLQVIVYAILAFFLSWQLTLSALIAGLLMVAALSILVRSARQAGEKQTETFNEVLVRIIETLSSVKPLKAMGKTDNLLSMMENNIVTLQKTEVALDTARYAVRILSEPIMVIFTCLGIYAILTYGDFPISELLFLSLLFLRMVTKVSAVQGAYISMVANESAFWSLRSKIDSAAQAKDYNQGTEKVALSKSIRLDNVSFSYDDHVIFESVSFELPARGFNVLFGPSGEGKTTLLDLIIGLHRPVSGTVYIDDTPLASLDLQNWRSQIGYVPQEILLFHDTIANNVTLNNPEIGQDEIEKALKMAGAFDFVQKMEHGIETVVGERGSKISGGQRQRLAIARALIAHPSLLILDEATSALDEKTATELLKTVKGLSKDILVILISHNPRVLDFADTVLKLENGALADVSFEQLKRVGR
ncbi:MAG: ABC transporter ATP-binding protein [Alphaproteobacteria bacterium]|nr:MAG: ABC transporter ATP-binding protein [Alphaproteobacteria bacterium]